MASPIHPVPCFAGSEREDEGKGKEAGGGGGGIREEGKGREGKGREGGNEVNRELKTPQVTSKAGSSSLVITTTHHV